MITILRITSKKIQTEQNIYKSNEYEENIRRWSFLIKACTTLY